MPLALGAAHYNGTADFSRLVLTHRSSASLRPCFYQLVLPGHRFWGFSMTGASSREKHKSIKNVFISLLSKLGRGSNSRPPATDRSRGIRGDVMFMFWEPSVEFQSVLPTLVRSICEKRGILGNPGVGGVVVWTLWHQILGQVGISSVTSQLNSCTVAFFPR